METETLQTLLEIRNALYVLTAFASFAFIVWLIYAFSRIKANLKKAMDDDFTHQANKYFEVADFEKLAQHCNEQLTSHPNHIYALWWLARTKLEIGKVSEAKALFRRVHELAPSWKETHIDPYLEKLNSGQEPR